MVNILAIDTATGFFSIALGAGDRVYHFEEQVAADFLNAAQRLQVQPAFPGAGAGSRHSELLLDCAGFLTEKAGITPADIEAVLVMKGPGSFTGLRIAYAAAKGIALALGSRMSAFPSLDVMAFPFFCWPDLVMPVINAGKGRFFTALYRDGRLLAGPMDTRVEAEDFQAVLKPFIDKNQRIFLTGPDAAMLKDALKPFAGDETLVLDPSGLRGYAPILLEVEKKCGLSDNDTELCYSGPEYLRKSDAELNLKK
ncbi:MAG: tRNA (adenosine(37)-N6)-threonylcarbamoyltransferase complex dimerization subunit type 1 TsaB [Treponema sp.]|jgi:tRNA threonylcarbamoyladenosine biosynthesis protein TsaB|nr:tRNA (adenosine(37)-N6)-threonylcarbamoyltransferase complex dimerization subunit type 1 TsaB [Treponema sp.]